MRQCITAVTEPYAGRQPRDSLYRCRLGDTQQLTSAARTRVSAALVSCYVSLSLRLYKLNLRCLHSLESARTCMHVDMQACCLRKRPLTLSSHCQKGYPAGPLLVSRRSLTAALAD